MLPKVLHIAPTPLVAAPGKLSRALRKAGCNSLSVALNDYPQSSALNGKFVDDTIVLDGASSETIEMVNDFASSADVIHIHNDLPPTNINWLRERATRASLVYQVHSPLREGPLYFERAPHFGLPIRAKLAVGQYQPRHYPDYIAVPNIVADEPFVSLRKPGERLRVLFSPSHSRGGRWNAKCSDALEQAIKSLQALHRIDAVRPSKPLTPATLMSLRRTCHVSIDEIVTGAFHQVSIEGLCAGNVVINRADFFSKAMMAQCANTTELPPFVYADSTDIHDVLLKLSEQSELTAEIQIASHDYFKRHLMADHLVQRFVKIYETLQ